MYDGHFMSSLHKVSCFFSLEKFGFPLPLLNNRLNIAELSYTYTYKKGCKIRKEMKKLTHVIVNTSRRVGFSLHRFNKVNIILKTGF